jgi:hypothetical protein
MVEPTKSRDVIRMVRTAMRDVNYVMIANPFAIVAAFAIFANVGAFALVAQVDGM